MSNKTIHIILLLFLISLENKANDSLLLVQKFHECENLFKAKKYDAVLITGKNLDQECKAKHLLELQKQNAWLLSQCYEKLKQYELSFNTLVEIKELDKQIIEEAISNDKEKKRMAFELNNKALQDSIKYANQHRLNQLEIDRSNALNEVHESRIKQMYFVGVLMLIAIIVVFFRYRNKMQANALIAFQKKEIEIQKDIAQQQKNILSQQHQEITKSLIFAKKIQSTTFPTESILQNYLPNHFIYYQPKDIISGDFYWFEEQEGYLYVAAADSTGHGVPGAIVSLVNYNKLNESLKRFHKSEPHHLLDQTSKLVQEAFTNEDIQLRDGMDIALCKINISKNILEYSGANAPLYLMRNNELIKIKGDKQPIGYAEGKTPFTKHNVDLKKGDVIYLFSDGFQDQFGGPKNSKFKIGKFDKLLTDIHQKPMLEQKELLQKTFNKWKGNEEQTDDVLVIGFKI